MLYDIESNLNGLVIETNLARVYATNGIRLPPITR